ncbi:7031_t:CDS:2 [Ambispora gerdemannii]|uniref:7031_t:CDS:1 n=1 Tax=Ambispora gerdemannii TaxID=144530 RepID=A0A9N9D3R8_9GLOM|nr:7031_t:CDS:2 [Ambispora gerdemannii]
MTSDSKEFYPGYLELVRYLNENETYSYSEFLDTILTSVRSSDEWFALDNTWTRRFLFKAKELKPTNFTTLESISMSIRLFPSKVKRFNPRKESQIVVAGMKANAPSLNENR